MSNTATINLCFGFGWLILIASFIGDVFFPNSYVWFPRSGAVLCMLSLFAEFQLNKIEPKPVTDDLTGSLQHASAKEIGVFPETIYDKKIKYFAHISVAAGTLVWAYGDLFV